MFDLSDGQEIQITNEPSSQFCSAISGDSIVWDDRRNGSGNGVRRAGLAALRESREALLGMWQGLEPMLEWGGGR